MITQAIRIGRSLLMKKIYPGLLILSLILPSIACSQFLRSLSGPSVTGRIVYQSNQDGNFDLYSIDVQRGTLVRLTDNSANDISPTFISSTSQIGFVSDRSSSWNLYVMDTSGTNVMAITNNKDKAMALDYPSWSPDGKLIGSSLVENCERPATNCYFDIYVMKADGTNLKNLTNTPAPKSEWVPVWSPDGQRVAFASDRDGDSEVYIMDNDGSDLVQLTKNNGYDGHPRWSPDGNKLVFDTDRDGPDWDIYIMDADGRNPTSVTTNFTTDFSVSWSPDGHWLVYLANIDGDNEIFIIDINGQNQQRLTNNTYNEISPIWIP